MLRNDPHFERVYVKSQDVDITLYNDINMSSSLAPECAAHFVFIFQCVTHIRKVDPKNCQRDCLTDLIATCVVANTIYLINVGSYIRQLGVSGCLRDSIRRNRVKTMEGIKMHIRTMSLAQHRTT